jgi:hypothetical protein
MFGAWQRVPVKDVCLPRRDGDLRETSTLLQGVALQARSCAHKMARDTCSHGNMAGESHDVMIGRLRFRSVV